MKTSAAGSRRSPATHRGPLRGPVAWLLAAVVPAVPAVGDALDTIAAGLPQVVHAVHGSPEPPPPFRAQRVLPGVRPAWPVAVAAIPGSDRLLVIEQREAYGPAWISCTTAGGEGLEKRLDVPREGVAYSIAFDPRFAATGWLYVGWNAADEDGVKRSRITRWRIDPEPPHAIDPDSALEILAWDSNGHNGAAVAFAPDGMLFVSTGDGTSDSDTLLAGQRLDHLLAKVLRIDVRQADAARPYVVPADNPFIDEPSARPETWAYGLRNPWRMTCDEQGRLWVGNNGQDLWEQVYLVERGANYGWSVYEGSHPFQPQRPRGPTPIAGPLVEHHHAEARSLTGGIVAAAGVPEDLRGAYLYGDYSTGKVWAARVAGGRLVEHREIADTPLQITSFTQDASGRLLLTDHRGPGEGGLFTLVPNDTAAAAADFPRRLSQTGLFADLPNHRPVAGAIPYVVNAPLWSDDAHKERFVVWPAATADGGGPPRIDVDAGDRGWNLPEGTVTVKSFALEMPTAGGPSRRWVETRVMLKEQGEWTGYSYRWNDEQTDAVLVDRGGLDADFDVLTASGPRRQRWHFPSRTECMVCHSRAANFVLGLCTPQLNRPHTYGDTTDNQIAAWERLGLVRLPPVDPEAAARAPDMPHPRRTPETLPRLVDPADTRADLGSRARSYLHANCAHCHVEAGGGNARLQLSWLTPVEGMRLVEEPPLHGGFGLEEPRIVAAGAPQRSVLLHRIGTRGTGQMPQLSTSVVDRAAVELITAWIAGLEPPPAP